ncbi:MAG: response regulator transcription factor [Flavobacteriaceae bacterium]|nr:response regulator transcription factor [Flavobacteriaceae bacterium]MDG2314109.1 response regulator transcription factor [Flavobacteriaceae bacterium]
MIEVLIADPHPIIHKGIQSVFKDSSEVSITGNAFSTEELHSFLEATPIDVLVIELDIPSSDGISAIQRIKKDHPNIRVVVFSNQPEEVFAISSLKAGASGYLPKNAPTQSLVDAVLKVYSGGVFITNELAQTIAFDESTGSPRRMFSKLSMREVEVLKLLYAGKRNKDIAFELNINNKTVSTYRTRIMKKLNVKTVIELIRKAQDLKIDSF